MSNQFERSERVVDDYRKRKLAVSAFARIRDIIHGFERERDTDRRMARIGIVLILLILLILAISAYLFFGGEEITIS